MVWIKKIVEDLVNKHGTNNPYEIAEEKNIFVFERDMHEDILGFYKYIRRNKFIFINSNLTKNQKIYTCSHELGHSEMHPRIDTPFLRKNTLFSIDKIEGEADRFAVELLLSDSLITEYLERMTIQDIASLHELPLELVELKCKKLFL